MVVNSTVSAFIGHVNYFRVPRDPGTIPRGITSHASENFKASMNLPTLVYSRNIV